VDRPFKPGTTSVQLAAYDPEAPKRPVRELYGVFRRPRTDADRSAGELASRWGALDFGNGIEDRGPPPGVSAESWRGALPGDVVHEEGRLLLAGLGGEEDMLYAAPTRNDHVAHALLPNGGGGCGAPGPDGLHLGWTQTERGDLVVYGLVSDEIASVAVVVGGQAHEARMGENAFGLRLERTHEADLERVVLYRSDGTTTEIGLRPGD
jgi:hypothetical protein